MSDNYGITEALGKEIIRLKTINAQLVAVCELVCRYHAESTDQRCYTREQREAMPPAVEFADILDAAQDALTTIEKALGWPPPSHHR